MPSSLAASVLSNEKGSNALERRLKFTPAEREGRLDGLERGRKTRAQ
jgi:hypothetical protein